MEDPQPFFYPISKKVEMEEKIPLAGLTSDSRNDEIKEAAFAKLTETRRARADRETLIRALLIARSRTRACTCDNGFYFL